MSYSVLQLAPCGEYVLYDGKKQKAILSGSQSEMFDWKHNIEEAEQKKANREYFDNLREERLALLVAAGHTQQSAENFLKQNMPYLYE